MVNLTSNQTTSFFDKGSQMTDIQMTDIQMTEIQMTDIQMTDMYQYISTVEEGF